MRRLVAGWADAARSVGSALLDVWQAEASALGQDFARSGRELRGGLILVAVAVTVGFWTVGVGLWAVIEILTLRLSGWQAALIVFAAGALATTLAGWLARRRLKRIEAPLEAVKRRGQEHVEWWQQTVLPGLGAGKRADDDPAESSADDRS